MKNIVEICKAHVKGIFDSTSINSLHYHNWKHTMRVLNAVQEIVNHTEGVEGGHKEILELAVLFHDVAFSQGSENHEEAGTKMAEEFLRNQSYSEEGIEEVKKLIFATKIDYSPKNLLEEIIKDADLSHLGSTDYFETAYLSLFQELRENKNMELSQKDWATMCLCFIEKHEYHTEYAKLTYKPIKILNVQKLKGLEQGELASLTESDKKRKKKKKEKLDFPEKGIETMFRVSLRNHVNLSKIADNKANTLISVNAIIISIVLSTLFPKIDNNIYLIYPTLTLLVFSIITIILSILSTIPKTTHGMLTRDEVENKKGNLLFFGNFHKMSLTDYEWGISKLMEDKDYLYKTLTRDLYFLGKVLNRKYTLLRYSYYIFVIGLLISISLFVMSLKGNI